MGCRGCAGTAGYLLRDCGSVGPQPLPVSFCCAVTTLSLSTYCSRDVSSMCLRAKDHLEGTKVAAFPSLLRPTESPDQQRSGWRPPRSGDQEGDGRPGYPRRSGRPSARDKSSVWVRVATHLRRCGTQALCNFANTQPVTGGVC